MSRYYKHRAYKRAAKPAIAAKPPPMTALGAAFSNDGTVVLEAGGAGAAVVDS